ncbi:MAG: efflux RND transporter periplasmic adaptor subunit [Sedimentisphaerales bacterium]|nr:efflux RND transporter periplasmic adaptor subunit [Sedimentisphaerales bacterium]
MKLKNNKLTKIAVIIIVICLLVVIAGYFFSKKAKGTLSDNPGLTTHTVTRGDLVISITESGGIEAIKSADIRSEVEGRTSIISIVDEGYVITPEDVENGKILVKLDSSGIEKGLNQQELSYSSSMASLTEARESLEIQIKQNESDIQAGEMKARFALMDFKKYLGEELANILVADANGTEEFAELDFQNLLKDDRLGGEAQQTISQLTSDIELAKSRLERAEDRLEGTKELFKEGYVAETELKADELDAQSSKAQVERAVIALELFKLYEFPKEAEKLFSDYREALRELDRIFARTRSRLAQEEARLKNREASFRIEEQQLEKQRKQLHACTIKAPAPGQVVYASSTEGRFRRSGRTIEEGAEVYERQSLIMIPDTSQMKVVIKVHETWIGKIEPDQKAKITVSAFPDKTFEGKVIKKAPMADQENWFNPDLKVYSTDVSINGMYDFLKTGMTAKVQIVIDQMKDVLTVPIQSVTTVEGKKYCFVDNSGQAVRRQVQTGAFNADFVEIKSGVTEGERILLSPPHFKSTPSDEKGSKEQSEEPKSQPDDKGQQTVGQDRDQQQNKPDISQLELTDERIDQIMQGMSQFDPTNYERLNKLRQEDPEKFKEELKKQIQQFMQQRQKQEGQGEVVPSEQRQRRQRRPDGERPSGSGN